MSTHTIAPWGELVAGREQMTADNLPALPDDGRIYRVGGWPKRQQINVWLPGSTQVTMTLQVDATLDSLDVLPGFTYPVQRVFG